MVIHGQLEPRGRFAQPDGDHAVFRREIRRIGHQVGQRDIDRGRVGPHAVVGIIDVERQLQAFAQQPGRQLNQRFTHRFLQVDGLRLGLRAAGLQARHGQQLVDQAAGAVNTRDQKRQRLAPLGFRTGLQQVLRVHPQHRQGRAHFVGGVGNEAAFAAEHFLDLRQHAVQRGLHRFQFGGQRGQLHRFQGAGMPCAQGRRHIGQRLEPPADGQPDHRGQNQAAEYVGQQRVAQDAVDQVRAYVVALTHPDPQPIVFVLEQKTAPLTAIQVGDIAVPRLAGRLGK